MEQQLANYVKSNKKAEKQNHKIDDPKQNENKNAKCTAVDIMYESDSDDDKKMYDKSIQATIYELHQKQLFNGMNNKNNTLKLVNIIGGIDKILAHYLNESNNIPLSIQKLNDIKQILTTTQQQTYQNIPCTKIVPSNNNAASKPNDFYLDINNTYLHSFFSEKSATFIIKALHSKIATFLIISTVMLYMFMVAGILGNFWINTIFRIILCCFLWIPYDIFWILSSNRRAFKMVLKSFEFWLKLIYALMYGTLESIYFYHNFASMGYTNFQLLINLFSNVLLTVINFSAFIFCVSSFDAMKITKTYKVLLSGTVAFLTTFTSISYQFLMPSKDDYVVNITANTSFSFFSIFSSTSRILAIFMWKQAILTLIRKEKCVLIKYHPSITWADSSHSNLHQKSKPNTNVDKDDNAMTDPSTNSISISDVISTNDIIDDIDVQYTK